MLIGVDLDNTIICYDKVFYDVAFEHGWISCDTPKSKVVIKNKIISGLGNDIWTQLQVEVYGPRLLNAEAFPDAINFFFACKKADLPVNIISHKTKNQATGKPYDLRAAAFNWLKVNYFLDPSSTGLSHDSVFFYESREEKIAAIKEKKCTIFIDDLIEVFDAKTFDKSIKRILFDPNASQLGQRNYPSAQNWIDIKTIVSSITGLTFNE
jgi:hypothetical protein